MRVPLLLLVREQPFDRFRFAIENKERIIRRKVANQSLLSTWPFQNTRPTGRRCQGSDPSLPASGAAPPPASPPDVVLLADRLPARRRVSLSRVDAQPAVFRSVTVTVHLQVIYPRYYGTESPVAGVYGHAGANRGLGEIDGGDVARLEEAECGRQLCPEGGHALAACCGRRVGGAAAADEDDAGGESIGAHADHPVAELGSHRPRARDDETGPDHGTQERLPAGARNSCVALPLRLLEGVVDRDRESRMRLFGYPVQRTRHAVKGRRLPPPPCCRGGTGWRRAPPFSAPRAWRIDRETTVAGSGGARHRRNLTSQRSRCCRSTEGR